MRKILLPTDFSDNATNALEYAFSLFGFEGVKYILLHAYTEPHGSADMLVSINDILQKQAKEDLTKYYNQLIKKHPEATLNIEHRLEYGSVAHKLKVIVEQEAIDYIVMGTKGASGLKKAIIGSNTSSVIRRVKCSIIAVPEKASFNTIKKVALATDYEGLENTKMLAPLIELTRNNNSEILAVNITKEPVLAGRHEYEIKGMSLGREFEGIPQRFFTIDDSDVVRGIKTFVREHNVDILAMIAKKHPLFERLFNSSITKGMAMVGEVPLLIIRGED